MYNSRNSGTCTGIICAAKKGSNEAITKFQANKDGSQRIALAVMVSDNFKSRVTDSERAVMSEAALKRIDKDGRTYKAQRIGLTKFLPFDRQHNQPMGIAMYERLVPGDMVQVAYSVRSGSYVDKDGKTVYTTSLEIESLQLLKHAAPKAEANTPSEVPAAAGDTDESAFFDPTAEGGEDEPF